MVSLHNKGISRSLVMEYLECNRYKNKHMVNTSVCHGSVVTSYSGYMSGVELCFDFVQKCRHELCTDQNVVNIETGHNPLITSPAAG